MFQSKEPAVKHLERTPHVTAPMESVLGRVSPLFQVRLKKCGGVPASHSKRRLKASNKKAGWLSCTSWTDLALFRGQNPGVDPSDLGESLVSSDNSNSQTVKLVKIRPARASTQRCPSINGYFNGCATINVHTTYIYSCTYSERER